MVTVELRFTAGRFHATPWGRHVNEAAVEWPPSPYRILRALWDVWKRRHAEYSAEAVGDLLFTLGSAYPSFWLPPAVNAHTRSYLSSNTKEATNKSLIFDGFLALNPDSPCRVYWPVELTRDQKEILGTLLRNLNYLGRSESWVEASLTGEPSVPANCKPAAEPNEGSELDLVAVACAVPPSEYVGKRKWLDALTYSTTEMLKERRSGPLAMSMVPYTRERDAVATWLAPVPARGTQDISVIELSLHSKVLPLATDTVRVAELVRAALMKRAGEKSVLFSGKDANGTPSKEQHGHTFYLPQFDTLDRIDRVLLLLNARRFGPMELDAVRSLRRLWQFGEESMRVVVTRAEPASGRRRVKTVESTTPFVPARYWRKGRGSWSEFVIEEIESECRNHGLPAPTRVGPSTQDRRFESVHFRRSRKGEPPRRGEFLQVEFPEPVAVPFSLGYCCHFGLGQFA